MNTRGTWFMRDIPVMIWLLTAGIISVIHPFFDSARWLIVHLVALGGFTHSIMVWSAHFSNALLKTKQVDSRREQNIRLGALQIGILAVFIGVPTSWWWLTIVGAILISAAVLWHAARLIHRLRIALPGRFRISVRYYVVAAAFLPIGVVFGVLLAHGLPEVWHGRLLVAHTMVNMLAWVGLAVLGTLVTLWPTMLRTRMAKGTEQASTRALPILGIGLTIVVVSPLVDFVWLGVAGVAIYLAGVMVVYVPIWQAARSKAPHSFPTFSAAASLTWLPIALITLAVKFVLDGWENLATSYGVLTVMFVVGFALQMLLGALSYLIPVVIGGGPRPLRAGIAELDRLATWRVFTTNIAIALCLLPIPPIVRVILSSLVLLVLGLTLIIILRGIFIIIRTKRQVDSEKAAHGGVPKAPTPRDKRLSEMNMVTNISGPQLIAAVAVIALGATVGVGLDPTAAGLGTQPSPNAVSEDEVQPTGEVTEVDVTMENMRFHPESIDVPAGNELVINLSNTDASEVHDLLLANGVSSDRLAPGDSTIMDVGVIDEDLEGWCSIVGHREMGMVFDINMINDGDQAASNDTLDDEHDAANTTDTAGGSGAVEDLDFQAAWPDEFTGYDPELDTAPSGTTHKYTFEVTEEPIEIAPGVKQVRWTFNGDSVGPTLRGEIGDTFEIDLVNNGTMGHSVDFHASNLAPDEPMRTIVSRSGKWHGFHIAWWPMDQGLRHVAV